MVQVVRGRAGGHIDCHRLAFKPPAHQYRSVRLRVDLDIRDRRLHGFGQ
jgi:hypothetical protein